MGVSRSPHFDSISAPQLSGAFFEAGWDRAGGPSFVLRLVSSLNLLLLLHRLPSLDRERGRAAFTRRG